VVEGQTLGRGMLVVYRSRDDCCSSSKKEKKQGKRMKSDMGPETMDNDGMDHAESRLAFHSQVARGRWL
jgi:hypothetical protein